MGISEKKHLLGWVILGGYFVSAVLLHLKVSKFLIEPLPFFSKRIVLLDYFNLIAFFILALVFALISRQFNRGERRLVTCTYWFFLVLTVIGSDRFLLFKNIEYIHYPQYAGLAYLLGKWRDPEREKFFVGKMIFWTTFLGVIDETVQYFYLCPSYGNYLDFNDFFLNLQGACIGMLLYYGFRMVPKRPRMRPRNVLCSTEALTVTVCFALIMLMASTGRLSVSPPHPIPPGGIGRVDGRRVVYLERGPGIFGSWNKGVHRGGRYYVLNPWEGLFLLFSTGLIFASYGKPMSRRNR
jgi:hypothetical protein